MEPRNFERRTARLVLGTLVGIGVMVGLIALAVPAQAHHRTGHGNGPAPSPTPSPSPTPVDIAFQIRHTGRAVAGNNIPVLSDPCIVTVPEGSGAVTVLEEAKAMGCLDSYQLGTAFYWVFGYFTVLECVNDICVNGELQDEVFPKLGSSRHLYWALADDWGSVWGVDHWGSARQGRKLFLRLDPNPMCPWPVC